MQVSANAGNARLVLLVCLVLCALGGLFLALLLWSVPATWDPAPAVSTRPAPDRERPVTPSVRLDLPTPSQVSAREGVLQELLPRTGPAPETDPQHLFDRDRYRGLGSLHISVRTDTDVVFPESWTLVLEPSKVLIGGQYASGRRVLVTGGVRELVLDDVPLGGYSVRAQAPRMNGVPKRVLLAQPHESDQNVFLELKPAGFLTGRVVDSEGGDVAGVPIVLEPLAAGARRSAHTDPAGVYVFEDVLDGEYRLYAGVPESPLIPARELAFSAPSLTMPDLELPVLGQLSIQVFERGNIPAPAIHITGFGQQGGRIDVTTDIHGEALARFLPPGWFTLLAQHGDGSRTRARVRLKPAETGAVVIVLER